MLILSANALPSYEVSWRHTEYHKIASGTKKNPAFGTKIKHFNADKIKIRIMQSNDITPLDLGKRSSRFGALLAAFLWVSFAF